MKKLISTRKKLKMLLIFILLSFIFITFIYYMKTLTTEISNETKDHFVQKGDLEKIVNEMAGAINRNVSVQPNQVNSEDSLFQNSTPDKNPVGKGEKYTNKTINKSVNDKQGQVNSKGLLNETSTTKNIIPLKSENINVEIINKKVTDKAPKFYKPEVECFYKDTGNILEELNDTEPTVGNSIFFHECSCPKDIRDIKLSFRQACSVESALKAHPEKDVFLLISSPVKVQATESRNVFIKGLLTYKNFNVRHINFERYAANTPTKILYDSNALDKSQWPTHHASDILRYTTLYKFGGLYLDLDVIVLKSLSNLTDFTGTEKSSSLSAGVIHFSSSQVGKEMAVDCAKEQARTFDGQQWSGSSVGVIRRVLEKRCGTETISEMTESKCRGFHVYPVSYFYPIYYTDYKIVFESGKTELVKSLIHDSYTLHVWSKFSAELDLKGSDIPYMNLAETYCPKMFRAFKDKQ